MFAVLVTTDWGHSFVTGPVFSSREDALSEIKAEKVLDGGKTGSVYKVVSLGESDNPCHERQTCWECGGLDSHSRSEGYCLGCIRRMRGE